MSGATVKAVKDGGVEVTNGTGPGIGLVADGKDWDNIPDDAGDQADPFLEDGADDLVFLSREDILSSDDRVVKIVPIPEWDRVVNGVRKRGAVHVRSLSGRERDQFEETIVQRRGKHVDTNLKNLRARLLARACVLPDGKTPMFVPSDIITLGAKNASAIDRIFTVAQELSGLSDRDVEELTKV